jgi:hypothetical protein
MAQMALKDRMVAMVPKERPVQTVCRENPEPMDTPW